MTMTHIFLHNSSRNAIKTFLPQKIFKILCFFWAKWNFFIEFLDELCKNKLQIFFVIVIFDKIGQSNFLQRNNNNRGNAAAHAPTHLGNSYQLKNKTKNVNNQPSKKSTLIPCCITLGFQKLPCSLNSSPKVTFDSMHTLSYTVLSELVSEFFLILQSQCSQTRVHAKSFELKR